VGRKFVSQTHYNRFRVLSPADAEQLVARFRQGVPKRQLACEYGIALTTVRRVFRRHRD
jgi:DNA invertase Pin-like site-specific DNA recombinase